MRRLQRGFWDGHLEVSLSSSTTSLQVRRGRALPHRPGVAGVSAAVERSRHGRENRDLGRVLTPRPAPLAGGEAPAPALPRTVHRPTVSALSCAPDAAPLAALPSPPAAARAPRSCRSARWRRLTAVRLRSANAGAQLPYPVCAPAVLTVDVRAVTVGVNDRRCAVTERADRPNHREALIPNADVDDGCLVQVAHPRMIAAQQVVHESTFARHRQRPRTHLSQQERLTRGA